MQVEHRPIPADAHELEALLRDGWQRVGDLLVRAGGGTIKMQFDESKIYIVNSKGERVR